MSKFHGLDCDCCKDKIPGVQEILAKISSILPQSGEVNSDKTVQSLENLAPQLKAYGGIDDLVDVAREFLKSPTETISVEQLKLDDPEKRVGNFKASELSDVPSLDITKILPDLPSKISGFKKLKFSIYPQSMVAEKTMNFGLFSLGIKFIISRKGVSWFPIISNAVDTTEDALSNLQGIKRSEVVSYKTPLNKAKQIARETYPDSPDVMKAVDSSKTIEDFISVTSSLGVQLFEEIDVAEEMRSLVDQKKKEEEAPIYEDEDCGAPNLVPAPFNPVELKTVESDCCGEPASADVAEDITVMQSEVELQEIEKEASSDNNLSDAERDEALNDTNGFLSDVDKASQIMRACAIEKDNAINNYYWYLEASYLNELSLYYAESRSLMVDALRGSFETLLQAREDAIEKSVELKSQENDLLNTTLTRLKEDPFFYYGYTIGATAEPSYVLDIKVSSPTVVSTAGKGEAELQENRVKITQYELFKITNDLTYQQAKSSIDLQYQRNEERIQLLTSQIEDQKSNFALPSFTESQILEFQTFGSLPPTGASSSILANKVRTYKEEFLSYDNPISNQVGFSQDLQLKLFLHPNIVEEARSLFATFSPQQGDVSSYINSIGDGIPLGVGVPFGGIGATTTRLGNFATDVWNKYYNSNRVDLLFTYLEQGYTSPKPQYDVNGNPIGPTRTVKIKSSAGEVEQSVAQSALDLGVNQDIALEFWPALEQKTREKIISLLNSTKESQEYENFLLRLKAAGEMEAKYVYSVNLIFQEFSYTNRSFDSYTNSFNFNQSTINNSLVVNLNNSSFYDGYSNLYKMAYDSLRRFQKSITDKMNQLDDFIELKKQCIADQEKEVEEKAIAFSKKSNGDPGPPGKNKSAYCQSKLGSDPFGLKGFSDCPGITKNCYWREYTKLMQIVSLMPIPDVERLTLRLFRYWPVGIQIPVPSPAPVILPTLASGLPDPFISIPLPIVWKHVITISTPVGLFVTWIGLCGPIPGPYVMYIDENAQACFLVTPKGPISIPAGTLGMTDPEEKSLIDYLSPIKDTFRIPLVPPLDALLMGNSKLKLGDPDDVTSIIDKIQDKIKATADAIPDISFQLGGTASAEFRKKVKAALRNIPPDIQVIQEAFDSIETAIDEVVDNMKISPIKFPKNPKKLITPVIGPAEFLDDINKLKDALVSLGDLGFQIKMISLRAEVKKFVDRELSDPEVKAKFVEINQEIREFEQALALDPIFDEEAILERVRKIKKALKEPVKKVADKITPEMLGFVALITIPIPLPVPCYDDIIIPPLPPYILALMAAIKALPELIDGIPEEALAEALSLSIDLSFPLPTIEDSIYFVINAFLQFVPNLSFPDTESVKALKMAIKSSIQNFFKIKIRLPHPGTLQIVIPPEVIKTAIKTAIKAAFAALVTIVINKLIEASASGDIVTVLAVVAIIKAVLGSDLGDISGNDIKAFIVSSLESIDEALDGVKSIINPILAIGKIDFKSIKEQLFPLPPKIFKADAFLEIGTKELIDAFYPLLRALEQVPIPFPLVLLGCSVTPSRFVLTKIHPFVANEKLPTWEKMSLENIPFVIWLDQLVATAQKQGGLGNSYLAPYWTPDV